MADHTDDTSADATTNTGVDREAHDDQIIATDSDVPVVVDRDADDEMAPIDTTVSDAAMIATARRRHGALGGIVAAGMLGIDKVLGRKPREEIPVVVDAPTEPVDIDTDGIIVPLDAHTDVISPPLPRTAPVVAPARRRRR